MECVHLGGKVKFGGGGGWLISKSTFLENEDRGLAIHTKVITADKFPLPLPSGQVATQN